MKFTPFMARFCLILTTICLLLTGCGDSIDPGTSQILDAAHDNALGEDELEKRQEGDEVVLYRKDDQSPYTGWFKARWDDTDSSSIRIIAHYKNGRRDGPYLEYDEMYREKLHGQFKNGKRDGFWTEVDQSEDMLQEGNYKNGKKDGPWIETHFDDDSESGFTETKVNYVNGERITP